MGSTVSFASATAATAVAAKRNRIIRKFREAGALTPETAVTLDDLQLNRQFIVQTLINRRVLVEAEDGRLYLDEDRNTVVQSQRRRLIFSLLVIAFIVLVFLRFYSR